MVEKLGFLVLGWLFGLLSPLVTDVVKRSNAKREIRAGLTAELGELRYRMAATLYQLSMETGEWNRQLMLMLLPVLESYKGVHSNDNYVAAIKKFLELDDEQLEAITQKRASLPTSLAMKRLEAPFLESKIGQVALFKMIEQRKLLEVRVQLGIYNEVVADIKESFRMTFQNLDEGNRIAIQQNLLASYKNAAERCRLVIRLIEELGFA